MNPNTQGITAVVKYLLSGHWRYS